MKTKDRPEEIKSSVVNVITEDGKINQMVTSEAQKLADEQGLDLILLNNSGDVPVVRIGDYNKYLYEKNKKAKESKKRQKANSQTLKEIQISDSIAEHDLEIKAKSVDRLLSEGHKVQLSIRYKGRAITFIKGGIEKLNHLESRVTAKHKIDKAAKISGNQVTMVISPTK